MNEEQQLENIQASTAGVSAPVEYMESEPMSSEANLPTDPEVNLEHPTAAGQNTADEAGNVVEEFTLEPDPEPFDLSPEPAAAGEDVTESLKATIKELSQTIDSLKAQLDEATSQLEDRKAQQVRLAADFENYRKRTQKEKEDLEQQIKGSTIKELLPVVDNFERARSQLKPQTDSEMNLHKSYQGVYKDLVDRLKKIGVSPMRAEGEQFDPNLHEAVMRETTDQHPEGTVVEELRRGYQLGDLVLRHAMVKVAAAPELGSESNANSD